MTSVNFLMVKLFPCR